MLPPLARSLFLMLLSCHCAYVHASDKTAYQIIQEARKLEKTHIKNAQNILDSLPAPDKRGAKSVLLSLGAATSSQQPSFHGFGKVGAQEESCGSCASSFFGMLGKEEKPQETVQYTGNDTQNTPQERQPDDYLLCVSFSMPKESLKALLRQAKKAGVRVVVRGLLDNSWKKTMERMRELDAPLDIDPEMFTKYEVTRVPTFIKTSEKGFHRLQGNVSLSFAMKTLDTSP